MPANPMEPVPRVAIIRLASMQEAVEPTAVGIFNLLANFMRRFVVVVPEQDGAAQQFLPGAGQRCLGQEPIEALV